MNEKKEFLKALTRGMRDPVFFADYFCGVKLHDGQIRWMTQGQGKKERMLATANRWGKSLVAAVKLLYCCVYQPRSKKYEGQSYRALNLAITLDQAKIAWLRAELMMQRRELSWALLGSPIHKPFPVIRFSNGSALWARSTDQPKNLWGFDFDHINYDEAAFEKHTDEILPLIRTRLIDRNGNLDYMSTPRGKSNWYYRQWLKGKAEPDKFYCQEGEAKENPFISEDALADLYDPSRMTELQRLQHLEGKFVDFSKSVFRFEDIEEMFDSRMQFQAFIPGHRYLDGWDIATKQDKTVGITCDVTKKPYKVVAFESFRAPTPWDTIYRAIRKRQEAYHSVSFIDTTGIGQHIPEELADLIIVPILLGPKQGPRTTSKTQLIINLQQILERKDLKSPLITELTDELTFYEWEDKKLVTDCVIALAVCLANVSGETPEAIFDDLPLGDQMVSVAMKEQMRGRLATHG